MVSTCCFIRAIAASSSALPVLFAAVSRMDRASASPSRIEVFVELRALAVSLERPRSREREAIVAVVVRTDDALQVRGHARQRQVAQVDDDERVADRAELRDAVHEHAAEEQQRHREHREHAVPDSVRRGAFLACHHFIGIHACERPNTSAIFPSWSVITSSSPFSRSSVPLSHTVRLSGVRTSSVCSPVPSVSILRAWW